MIRPEDEDAQRLSPGLMNWVGLSPGECQDLWTKTLVNSGISSDEQKTHVVLSSVAEFFSQSQFPKRSHYYFIIWSL